jgi:hypothetical protein
MKDSTNVLPVPMISGGLLEIFIVSGKQRILRIVTLPWALESYILLPQFFELLVEGLYIYIYIYI